MIFNLIRQSSPNFASWSHDDLGLGWLMTGILSKFVLALHKQLDSPCEAVGGIRGLQGLRLVVEVSSGEI